VKEREEKEERKKGRKEERKRERKKEEGEKMEVGCILWRRKTKKNGTKKGL